MRVVEGPGLGTRHKALVIALYLVIAIAFDRLGWTDAIQVTNALIIATFALGHLAVSRPIYRQGLLETRLWGALMGLYAVATMISYHVTGTSLLAGWAAFVLLDAFVEATGWPLTRFGLLKSILLLSSRLRAVSAAPQA